MQRTLLIIDIDGTLLAGQSSGRLAMEQACAECLGVADALRGMSLQGRTDRAILEEAAARAGQKLDGPRWEALGVSYCRWLGQTLVERGAQAIAGAREFVTAAAGDPRFCLALGTGNLEPAAHLKMRHIGLDRYFPVGGFGMRRERPEVIAEARGNAAAHWGEAFGPERTVVIGDAPLDVVAARANGFRVLAVTTGGGDLLALVGERPDVLVPDLGDIPRLLAWLAA